MALIYYLTNYATKIQDPIWKRVAIAVELFLSISTTSAVGLGTITANYKAKANLNCQYLMRIANRIFTERLLLQVEVIAHFLDYLSDDDDRPIESTGGNGNGSDAEASAERVLVGSDGKKLLYIEAYHHRGEVLQTLCFYDYVLLVKLQKRIDSSSKELVKIEFERNWRPGRDWVQIPQVSTSYRTDGMDTQGVYTNISTRAAVQHLALFVLWEKFTIAASGDINKIWEYWRRRLPKRLQTIAGNIQLLKRSAEDARRDAKQWAAAGDDAVLDNIDAMGYNLQDPTGPVKAYRPDQVGQLYRLMEIVLGATASNQVTADDLEAVAPAESPGKYQLTIVARSKLPMQYQLKGIKSKQGKADKEIVQRIQGSDGVQDTQNTAAGREALLNHTFAGAGEDSMEISETDTGNTYRPSTRVAFGLLTTFLHAGRQIASRFTLNEQQKIAFLLVCRHLDTIRNEDNNNNVNSSNAENNHNA
ncbi:hypothetical protein AUP68_16958 [Ilyonectria robusta]